MKIEDYRRFYAEEIRLLANLPHGPLVEAFATVPRERFLGPPPWNICSPDQSALASLGLTTDLYVTTSDPRDLHHNVLVSILPEQKLNNGQPSALAHWVASLDLRPGDHVYHAGCGVGYYTAILAEMVGAEGTVRAIDVEESLAARAAENLSVYQNVTVATGDGASFDPGPCDAMMINAGVTHLPPLWLDLLKDGGRLLVPITGKGNGIMVKVTRAAHEFLANVVSFVAIYPFTTLRDEESEPLILAALVKRTVFQAKHLRVDVHEQTHGCLLHLPKLCLSR